MKKLKSGIYAIVNKTNNKKYIGSSKNVLHRWNQSHRPLLRKQKHKNKHLQNAWNKYGENNFEFQIIEICLNEMLLEKEGHWIEHYKSWDRNYGYNLIRYINGKQISNEKTRQLARKRMLNVWQTAWKNKNIGFIKFSLTNQKCEEVYKLRNQGLSWDESLKKVGISKTHWYRLKKGKDGKYHNGKGNLYNKITEEIKTKAIELRKQNKKWVDIANELGISVAILYSSKIAQQLPNMVRLGYSKELGEKITSLRNQRKTWKEIAKEINGCEPTVKKYYKKYKYD